MAISLIFKKYKVEIADDSVPAQDTFSFSLIDSWDISNDLMEDVVITRELESDAAFNFAVSSISLNVNNNAVLSQELKSRENLVEYTYGVEVYKDDIRRFVGQIDQNNITYDVDMQTWQFRARDWYKFFYDKLSIIKWNYLSGGLGVYLSQTFGLGDTKFLQMGTVDIPFVDPNAYNWRDADANIENLITYGLLSRADYLFEVIKYYGAFLYVDENYKLNFINRAKQTPPIYAVPIEILDQTRVQTYLRDSSYDAILISQQDGVGSEESWKLVRIINNETNIDLITDTNQLNALHGTRILDIRQKLGAIASGTVPNVTYTWGWRFGLKIYPFIGIDETLRRYIDLYQRPRMFEGEIERTNDMKLLSYFFHNDGDGNIEYQTEKIEEDLVRDTMVITAKEHFRDSF